MKTPTDFFKEHQKTAAWLCFLMIFASLMFYFKWNNHQIDKKLLKSPAFAVGYFTGFQPAPGKGAQAMYYFTVNDTNYGGGRLDGRYRKLGNKMFEKSFPVIYNTQDPTRNQILVFSSDFSRMGLAYPDSLKWVEELNQ